MKYIFTFVFILLSFTFSQGAVKDVMDEMLKEVFELKPYIVSEDAYRDSKNQEKIGAALKQMVLISEKISHEGKIQKSGFAISSKTLNEQLQEAEHVFRVGSKDYSLWMLRSTLSVCMSCHTQLPSGSTKFEARNKEKFLAKPFDEAEFLFIVRNYTKALPLYSQVIEGYPKNNVTQDTLEKSIARKVYYYVRVQRDLAGLDFSLAQDQKNKKLPRLVAQRIKELRAASNKYKSAGYPEFRSTEVNELRKYAETQLTEELKGRFAISANKDLAYLKVSSVLYKFLDENPETPLKPEILYWLSFCERRYEQRAFYSLPELYLKQCIQEFPGAPVARACLKEYKDLVTIAYTGSSGTHIPKEIERELNTMKDLVEKLNGKKNQ